MGISSSTGVQPLSSNFLVPNGTFLVSLLAFLILVWIFGKYLIPPISKAMTERQEAIRKEFADLEDAHAGSGALDRRDVVIQLAATRDADQGRGHKGFGLRASAGPQASSDRLQQAAASRRGNADA